MRLPAFISKLRCAQLVLLVVFARAASVFSGGLLETMNREVSAIYEKSREAVVKVHAQRQVQIGDLLLTPVHRVGTGFFIDCDGHILTSATVVDDADSCWIDRNGQKVPAEVVGRDPLTNIALLKVDPERCVSIGGQIQILPQGNSDELQVGAMVIAIGYPFDLQSAPSVGFVSGLDILRGTRPFVTSHIRAGCKLRPGQGGGPLVNVRGEVVGIAVAAHMDDQCYALPINAARKISKDILETGEPKYGWVGLEVKDRQFTVGQEAVNRWHVCVEKVASNTPAAEAGFRGNDILIRITTNQVHRLSDVLDTMFYHRVGDKVVFTILRDGEEKQITLVVGSRPAEEPSTDNSVPVLIPTKRRGNLPVMVPVSKDR